MDGTEAADGGRALHVMASGHRENGLKGADTALLAWRIGQTLDLIAGSLQTKPRLVISLAEGADRIIVDEALERGWPLTAVLPFDRDEFERDFPTATSRRTYHGMLGRAAQIIEVPGVRGRDPGDGAAYAAANDVMLDRADLLLTVWDGEPARGPGGTAEVVALARGRGIPVIWIDAQPPHGIRLLGPDDADSPSPWWSRLAAHVADANGYTAAQTTEQ